MRLGHHFHCSLLDGPRVHRPSPDIQDKGRRSCGEGPPTNNEYSSETHCHGGGDPGKVKALHLASLQHVAEYMRGLEPVNGPLKLCREGDGIALHL